ncbi:MAG TPA: LysR family transcriptional regulator [Baekduia sp.]|uniref:LysR substrate-binding domain-containing protein n=1 Tax=Baekduia sp. TaxID=2600305 RepID=UPI002B6542ED|nr:LysR family transcriptional regulator [Baekduia sp.]HMJ36197.1 LysR family transcriptional regulator [Baekduia sp.]
MTLRQLATFATVARLGSVKAAARELAISEPAVSAAVGVLRKELGDDLYHREGHGLVLTAQGERLASLATEIGALARRAHGSLGEDGRVDRLLHIAVTGTVEEHVVGPLLAAFTERTPDVRATVEVQPAMRFAGLLNRRRADIVLGPRPGIAEAPGLVVVPFLRYRMVIVAPPGHRLAGRQDVAPAELATDRWLVGADGVERGSPTALYLRRAKIAPPDVRAFPSDAAALSAVAAGEGVMLALWHFTAAALRRGTVIRLAVRGTPVVDLWHASTLPDEHCLTGASALRRFTTTADATQAMAAPRHGVPAGIVRAPVHATLWHSVPRPAPDGAGPVELRIEGRAHRTSGGPSE